MLNERQFGAQRRDEILRDADVRVPLFNAIRGMSERREYQPEELQVTNASRDDSGVVHVGLEGQHGRDPDTFHVTRPFKSQHQVEIHGPEDVRWTNLTEDASYEGGGWSTSYSPYRREQHSGIRDISVNGEHLSQITPRYDRNKPLPHSLQYSREQLTKKGLPFEVD